MRKYAGVFVVILPCGLVVTVHHLIGAESFPQVALAFAAALQLLPGKRFLCYDNACALARYCRSPFRSDATHMHRRLRDCCFVLPGSHVVRNHTACREPTNAQYHLPEVLKENHPELQGVNFEAQEQIFSWVRWLVHVANPMTPAKHRAFFQLLVLERNRRLGLPRPRRARPRFRIWRGAARAVVPAQPAPAVGCLDDFLSADARRLEASRIAPVHSGGGAAAAAAAEAPQPFVVNLGTRRVHRVSGVRAWACGSAFPTRCRFVADYLQERNIRLCLQRGCF